MRWRDTYESAVTKPQRYSSNTDQNGVTDRLYSSALNN